jgi:hypothetical protein
MNNQIPSIRDRKKVKNVIQTLKDGYQSRERPGSENVTRLDRHLSPFCPGAEVCDSHKQWRKRSPLEMM